MSRATLIGYVIAAVPSAVGISYVLRFHNERVGTALTWCLIGAAIAIANAVIAFVRTR